MQRSKLLVCLVAVACCLALASAAEAQTTGAVRGRVVDPDGAPLPGVTVTVRGDGLIGGQRTATTSVNGGYNFSGLPPGSYTLEAQLAGFRGFTQEDVRVSLGSATVVNFTMELSAVQETVTVTGEAPIVDTTSSSVSTNYDAEFIEDLPTTRNFFDLIQLSPGMSASYKQGNSDRTVAFGSNQQSNAWHVDGIDVSAPETGSSWGDTNLDAVAEIQVLGVGAPAEYGNMTGAVFNVVTKRGGNEFHGTGSFYLQDDSITGTNVTLPGEQFPSFERIKYNEATATLGGPIKKDRAWFYATGRYRRDQYAEPRNDPAFIKPNKNDTVDLKISTRLGDNNYVDLKGSVNDWDFPYYVGPNIAPESSAGERGVTPTWGALYRGVLSDTTLIQARYTGWWSNDFYDSQTGSTLPGIFDATPPGGGAATETQGVLWPWSYETWSNQLSADLSHYAQDFLAGDHDFKFGVQYSRGGFDTQVAPGPTGTYYYRYNYAYEYAGNVYNYEYWYQVIQRPFFYGGRNTNLALFADDSWQIGDDLTVNLGLRMDWVKGEFPDYPQLSFTGFPSTGKEPRWDPTGTTIPGREVMNRTVLAPRVGFAWTPTESKNTVVRGSFGIYRDGNVGGNWDFPSPGYPDYQWYWLPNYPSLDGRELVFEFTTDNIGFADNLKVPTTYQYAIGFEHQLGRDVSFGAQYVYKYGRDLVGWHIEGGVWEPVQYTDPFTGNTFTLLNMLEEPNISKGNGPGFTAAGNIDRYWQKYSGLILTFRKRFSHNWSMQASYTLSKSWGLIPRMLSQVQFNPFYGSLEGANPNNYINAEQRLQGDRTHMFRVQGNFSLPANIEVGAVVNLQSGRAHNRQIRVPGSIIGQGTRVIMTPAGSNDPAFGELRLPFEKTVDLAIGWRARLGDSSVFKIDAQIFNVFNDDAHTFYQTLVLQPGDTFSPDEFVWPRRLQVRAGFEF